MSSQAWVTFVQYISINMHMVFALLCFVVVIHWLIFPYPSGLLHWHCGNLTIAPVPAKQSWWIWINTSCEFIMNDCITTTKQSTTKPCAYFLGYTVHSGKNIVLGTDANDHAGAGKCYAGSVAIVQNFENRWMCCFILNACIPLSNISNIICLINCRACG